MNNITNCLTDSYGIIYASKFPVSIKNLHVMNCEHPVLGIISSMGSAFSVSKANFVASENIFFSDNSVTLDSIYLIGCEEVGNVKGKFTNCFSNIDGQSNFKYKADLTAQDLGIELIYQPPPSKPEEGTIEI